MIDMADEIITVAVHYATLASGLRPLSRKIGQAFINRPTPSGLPWSDLNGVAALYDGARNSISAVIAALKGCGNFQYTVFHVGANRVHPPSDGRAIMLAIPTGAYAIRPYGKFVISGSLTGLTLS
jgi:hypothetical protein